VMDMPRMIGKFVKLERISHSKEKWWTIGIVESSGSTIYQTGKGINFKKVLLTDLLEVHVHMVILNNIDGLLIIPGDVILVQNPDILYASPARGKELKNDVPCIKINDYKRQIQILGKAVEFSWCKANLKDKKCLYACKALHDFCIFHKYLQVQGIKASRMDLAGSNGYVHHVSFEPPTDQLSFNFNDDEIILNERKRKTLSATTEKKEPSRQLL
jgi:hypothetical protein